jgi:hypothetical protein
MIYRLILTVFLLTSSTSAFAADCERWGVYEVELSGPSTGNPFVGVSLSATFRQGEQAIEVPGFYDGDGKYLIRFSPPTEGNWEYQTTSNVEPLKDKSGELTVSPATGDNRGPVEVAHVAHFAYADGSPYKPIGTTCYAWTSQPKELEEQTLKTLAEAPFNKLRMCVFPKWYSWNEVDPPRYAFEGKAPNEWDFSRFNPEFFQHLEKRIVQLGELGIQADLILLHPYDNGRWGFDNMPPETCDS